MKRVSDRKIYMKLGIDGDDDCGHCVCSTSWVLEGREGQVLDRSG